MVRIQIMSDLHLELDEAYGHFNIPPEAPYLALLGDLGNFAFHGTQYTEFIERHLLQFKAIFYEVARTAVEQFCHNVQIRRKIPGSTLGDFVFLDNSRYDILNENVTILGATLFTNPPRGQRHCTDAYYRNEIRTNYDVRKHMLAHFDTMSYLSHEVAALAHEDPRRSIIILTHHCPTLNTEAVGQPPVVDRGGMKYRYACDLTKEHPWIEADAVKLWAFGSTHYNCDYVDEKTRKRVYSNQRGYPGECHDFRIYAVVDISAYDDTYDDTSEPFPSCRSPPIIKADYPYDPNLQP
ncbi:uncharacterized protein F4817DRAFT_366271 [Daldinia loculata]|uniref:uncharacterized protein n=1 Tax=Daldinia loculata TaxID=103429 RepID=UPI0020C24B94|nr:uncharacterized protein F4817DRAFT_366271 [Daldinia loculata]KAI1646068.1 hypothetical protein F4817DRAFT_366271 [Daldinia loculata]